MPALFSKPQLTAAATLLALLGSSEGLPVLTGVLPELNWAPCAAAGAAPGLPGAMWCTDVYFCYGPWANLTSAPQPPSATSGFAYSYRTNQTGDCIPGASPIMRVQPGQTYKITFHNTADMDPAFIAFNSTLWNNMQTAWTPPPPPGVMQWGNMQQPLHTTNVHIHGLHVSGEGDFDNVLRPVFPGYCQTYTYPIPANYPGGMNWYHPHAHGRVAYQVIGGAFGPFIIDDFSATLQTNGIGKDLNGKALDQPVRNFLSFRTLERVLNAYAEFGTRMGNGDPAGALMQLTANQWFRLRIVHAKPEGVFGTTAFMDPTTSLPMAWNSTTVPQCEVYEIAADGNYYSIVPYLPYAKNGATSTYEYQVHGAERLELAVRCLNAGYFEIWYDGGAVARVTVLPTPKVNPYPSSVASPFAAGGTLQWRPNRPPWVIETRPGFPGFPAGDVILPPQIIALDFNGINGVLFEQATGPIYPAQFNSSLVYEMQYQNTNPHPTHMHQQVQQIITPGGCGGLKEGEWYDTITALGANTCNVRTRFVEFTGIIVMHCHVLDHEDMGIMGYITVPFAAPGSFEASPAYTHNTKPGFCCRPRVDKNNQMVCRGVPECGTNIGINTCNQACTVPVNLCPATKPYCSTTGVCFLTVKTADGIPIPEAITNTCTTPVYPFVVTGVALAASVVAVIGAIFVVRRRSSNYSTILIEEMKQESLHMPTRNFSPFPGHDSPVAASRGSSQP